MMTPVREARLEMGLLLTSRWVGSLLKPLGVEVGVEGEVVAIHRPTSVVVFVSHHPSSPSHAFARLCATSEVSGSQIRVEIPFLP